ncbi:aminotransferase class V-fold PLP-dependent enzyme [Photobacterium sp. WH24]|uniref:pyridoxal phosphate-dependent decarboxylase family protein n=1 Tax=Photobacterium sp. WH24 TaxID=2827237 RepID=UPI001C44DEB9|nr:aminotransferase class V-fold PLP-dependent enzyme [Photobacterium sp. WH24]MBV7263365.1 aminotransferase class V-fold PLP-dependent enzyme [Photobacterium sp. WH24]
MKQENQLHGSSLNLAPEQIKKICAEIVDYLSNKENPRYTQKVRPKLTDRQYSDLSALERMPYHGSEAVSTFEKYIQLLTTQAVSTSHPGFLAYIMGAASDVSVLADFLAAAISAPQTSASTSHLTTMIEAQTIKWMCQLLGYPETGSGLFVSGGSIANLIALQAAIKKKRTQNIVDLNQYRVYVSKYSHSSISSAVSISGLLPDQCIQYIETTQEHTLSISDLKTKIKHDQEYGYIPLMVIGIAGCTSLGVIDPLLVLSDICMKEDIWFHIDAAYGGFAVLSQEYSEALKGMQFSDSLTIDPHKWMYAAADVGCILVKDPNILFNTFNQSGAYYSSDDLTFSNHLQFRDLGIQTTRSFRALKVKLSLEIAGRIGYQQMIEKDIHLAKYAYKLALDHPNIEAYSCHLSIVTLRFNPNLATDEKFISETNLNKINQEIIDDLHQLGDFFPSHTWVNNKYLIRLCIVNLNTTEETIHGLLEAIDEVGKSKTCNYLTHMSTQ